MRGIRKRESGKGKEREKGEREKGGRDSAGGRARRKEKIREGEGRRKINKESAKIRRKKR